MCLSKSYYHAHEDVIANLKPECGNDQTIKTECLLPDGTLMVVETIAWYHKHGLVVLLGRGQSDEMRFGTCVDTSQVFLKHMIVDKSDTPFGFASMKLKD